MKIYYLSLCRGLVGYYVKFVASSEAVVRRHAELYFGKLWCSVYTDAYFHEVIRRRYPKASKVINNQTPIELTDDSGSWE